MAGISKLAKFLIKKGHTQLVRDFSKAPIKTSLKLGGKALLFPLQKTRQGIAWAHKKQGLDFNFKELEIGTTSKFGEYGTKATGIALLGGIGSCLTEGLSADQKFDTDKEGYEKLNLLASKTLDATVAGVIGFALGGPIGAFALGTAAGLIPKDFIMGNLGMWNHGAEKYTFNDIRAKHAQKGTQAEEPKETPEEAEKTPEEIAKAEEKKQNAEKRIAILKDAGINVDDIKYSGYADGENMQITYNNGSDVLINFNMENNELVIQEKDSTRIVKADLTPFKEYITNPLKIHEEQTLVINTDTLSSEFNEIYQQLTTELSKQEEIPFDSTTDNVCAHYLPSINICHIQYADGSIRPVRLAKQKPEAPQNANDSIEIARQEALENARQDSIAHVQALQDSLTAVRQDSLNRVHIADSIANVQRDSLIQVQADSLALIQRDSLAQVQADSLAHIQRDSLAQVQADSLALVQQDSLTRVQNDSTQRAQANSVVSKNDSEQQQPETGAPDKNNIFNGAIHEIKAPEIHEVVAGNTVWAIVRKGLEDANPGVEITDTQVWYECLEIGKKNPEIFGENPNMQKLGKIYPKQKLRLVS